MELNELVGEHELSGVDTSTESVKEEWGDGFENCQAIRFRLDGITYMAIEDPDDGYRSSMGEIKPSGVEMKNVFPPVKVLCRMKPNDDQVNETLEIIDVVNGQTILEVGTDNMDDYYPWFVASFWPERMAVNQKVT